MSESKMREALESLVKLHRKHFGLDGAWDAEITNAEYLLAQPAAPVPEDLFKSIVSPTILAHIDKADELLVRRIWDDVRRAMLSASKQEK